MRNPRRVLPIVFLLCLSLLAAAQPSSDPPGGAAVGIRAELLWLLSCDRVHEELGTTREQVVRLGEIAAGFRAAAASARDGGPRVAASDLDRDLAGVLDSRQRGRLRQIVLQQRLLQSAPMVLLGPELSPSLAFTPEQRGDLLELARTLREHRRSASPDRDKMAKKANRKATEILTAGQKEELARLLGNPVDLVAPGAHPVRPAAEPVTRPGEPPQSPGGLGVGFLIGEKTAGLVSLLTGKGDFLEMVLGPEKVRHVRGLPPPAKAMCVVGSLADLGRTVALLREAQIEPSRVYLAYNPEPRPPGTPHWTPDEEVEDFAGSLKKARAMLADYPAELVMGPGLVQMGKREHLYPELARICDIWMIQSQRLQVDLETGRKATPAEYRARVKRIVEMLREGNPRIRVFVQIIPLTRRVSSPFTAAELADCLLAIRDLVESAKIYGGDAELIAEVVRRVRAGGAPAAGEAAPAEPPAGRADPDPTAGLRPGRSTLLVPMRDDARLATDIYLPAPPAGKREPGPVPVILIRTPYGKDRRNDAVTRWKDYAVGNGYACVIQDMRGFYASEQTAAAGPGAWDGYDTIEWLASQPWCDGKIGMMGFSHLGAAQYEAAVTAPPHLACAIPAQAPGNYYTDSLYPPRFRKADMDTILRGPITSRTGTLIQTRIRRRDVPRLGKFDAPMLHCGGWYDSFKEGAIEMFGALQEHGGPGARGKQKLLIGPWGHGVLQEEARGKPLRLPGGLAYPANAKLDFAGEVWPGWFDFWLRGRTTGVMEAPAVRYYLMGDVDDPKAPGNRWIEANTFPPPSVSTTFHLHSDGVLRTAAPAAGEDSLSYMYDPRNPVPWVGRVHARVPVKGPFDEREVEGRPDVLVFTTPVLEEPLTIVGSVRAVVFASSDRKDTDFTVKLTDVYPDGRSMFVLDGIVKARYRNTYLREELLEPGEVYEFEIDLGHIAIALAKGHRLRIAISSSCFDRWDVNPNTGEPYGDHATTRALLQERLKAEPGRGEPRCSAVLTAKNRIYMDREHPSRVELPVISSGTPGGVKAGK